MNKEANHSPALESFSMDFIALRRKSKPRHPVRKRRKRRETFSQRLKAVEDMERPVSAPTTAGFNLTVPIHFGTDNQGTLKKIRRKTIADVTEERVFEAHDSPSTRAIRMANALMLERILGSGLFRSAADMANQVGINRSVLCDMLKMLDLPPDEIERLLFEQRGE